MAKFLRLVNGVPRQFDEASTISVYDEILTVVADSPSSNEVEGPITTGSNVTLPNSGEYDSIELEVYLNGTRLNDVMDYNYEGSSPRTEVSFTFDLIVGDVLRFRVDRAL